MTDPAVADPFLRDIIAEPASDDLRLIFADWLQDHGDEARAEFIRVQIELARMPAPWCKAEARENNCEELGQSPLCDWCDLRRRERELYTTGAAVQWCGLREVPGATDWFRRDTHTGLALYRDGLELCRATFRRGFVASVTLPLAVWCGARCRDCGRAALSGPATADCRACRGTGRTGGHGPALVKASPLERVTLVEWRGTDCVACYRGRVRIGLSDNVCEACHGLYDSFACLAWAKGA